MNSVTTTISQHFQRQIVSTTPTRNVQTLSNWLASGDLTRESFDVMTGTLDTSPSHLGDLLDIILSFTRSCSEDLELTPHELDCVRTLKRLFRIKEGDFLRFRGPDVHEAVSVQLEYVLADGYIERAEDLHLVGLQQVFDLGFDDFTRIAHPDVLELLKKMYEDAAPHLPHLASAVEAEMGSLSDAGVADERITRLAQTILHLQTTFALNIYQDLADWIVGGMEPEVQIPGRSRAIPRDVRDSVWRRDEGKCVQCGSVDSLEFDHIIPFSKGGSNTYRNIQLLCESCNRAKSDSIG